jgi:hypothetical protein
MSCKYLIIVVLLWNSIILDANLHIILQFSIFNFLRFLVGHDAEELLEAFRQLTLGQNGDGSIFSLSPSLSLSLSLSLSFSPLTLSLSLL